MNYEDALQSSFNGNEDKENGEIVGKKEKALIEIDDAIEKTELDLRDDNPEKVASVMAIHYFTLLRKEVYFLDRPGERRWSDRLYNIRTLLNKLYKPTYYNREPQSLIKIEKGKNEIILSSHPLLGDVFEGIRVMCLSHIHILFNLLLLKPTEIIVYPDGNFKSASFEMNKIPFLDQKRVVKTIGKWWKKYQSLRAIRFELKIKHGEYFLESTYVVDNGTEVEGNRFIWNQENRSFKSYF